MHQIAVDATFTKMTFKRVINIHSEQTMAYIYK